MYIERNSLVLTAAPRVEARLAEEHDRRLREIDAARARADREEEDGRRRVVLELLEGLGARRERHVVRERAVLEASG